jgi:TonB family protein
MRQDFALSFLLHFTVVIALVFSTPFRSRVSTDLGEVINVHLATMPAFAEPKTMEPVAIPRAIEADEPLAVVPDMKTVKEAKTLKKEEKKPKDKEYKPQSERGKDQAGTESGKKDVSGSLGVGSKLGGAAVDNAAFDYSYWFVQSFTKIERNWSNPVFANRTLQCGIYFQVIRSGRIIKVEIEESSGIDAFDRACERAVKLSQPLPPLPNEFTDEILGIHLEFPYAP